MLIEVCFVDSADANQYLSVGHDAIAKAIAEALIGHVNVGAATTPSAPSKPAVKPQSYLKEAAEFVGSRCKELQEKLIKCGYSCGSYGADGIFGQATYDALVKFQRYHGLDADGLAGQKTFAKLDSLIASNNTSTYLVKITADVLNVRKGPGTNYAVTTTVKQNQVFTIVETNNGWGKLKSGAGWVHLSYTVKK